MECVLEEAMAGHPESVRLCNIWMESAVKGPIVRILEYMGENPDVSGGTIGAPNQVSDYAFLIREVFFDNLRAVFLHTLIQTDLCGFS